MELRPQEDHPKEQGHQADARCLATHVLGKTKVRTDWLHGQAPFSFLSFLPSKCFGSLAPQAVTRPLARLNEGKKYSEQIKIKPSD